MWMRHVVMWGTCCGDDTEVKIQKLEKMTEVDTKLQKRISGETGDK